MHHRRRPSSPPTGTPLANWPAGPALHRPADGDPRHLRRERRASRHGEGPRHQRWRHRLDDHELLADLRQPAPARRPRRRPARPPARVPRRPGRLHPLLARLGARRRRGDAVRRPRRPGPRRRHALPRGALDHHGRLHAGRRAGQGAGRLGRGRRRRRGLRRAARRHADRARRLAPDLPHQPPRRARARRRRAARRARPTRCARAGAASISAARCSPR